MSKYSTILKAIYEEAGWWITFHQLISKAASNLSCGWCGIEDMEPGYKLP